MDIDIQLFHHALEQVLHPLQDGHESLAFVLCVDGPEVISELGGRGVVQAEGSHGGIKLLLLEVNVRLHLLQNDAVLHIILGWLQETLVVVQRVQRGGEHPENERCNIHGRGLLRGIPRDSAS